MTAMTCHKRNTDNLKRTIPDISMSNTPCFHHTAIEAVHLYKTVADATDTLAILHDIHFSIPVNETVAIIGASGSGKTTLLSLLAGLDTPTSGTVRLCGIDIFAMSEDERAMLRKKMLGFVFQSFQLLPHLTALENVMLPLELQGVPHAASRALSFLKRVGLSSRTQHYPRYLSGGEQQRVALARAFVTEPPLLFADEPTGNLDTQTGQEIIELMFSMHRERHMTLVLVTHDLEIAARCHRVIEIRDGRMTSGQPAS